MTTTCLRTRVICCRALPLYNTPSCSTHSGACRHFPEGCCDEADAHWVCMTRNSLSI